MNAALPGSAPAASAGPLAAGAAAPLRVLVVEDLPRVQLLLRELIDEPGRFEIVGVAETERDAVEQYRLLRPQALIIDLNLRQGTGLGVIAAVRRLRADPPPLLLVLTNHALPVLESACLSAGADHFLDKSRDFHRLRPLLEQSRLALPPLAPGDDEARRPPPTAL